MPETSDIAEMERVSQEVTEAQMENYQSSETQLPEQTHPIEVIVETKLRQNPKPTPKYEEFQNERMQQRIRSFHSTYAHFKETLLEVKNHLKGELFEDDLMQLHNMVGKENDQATKSYDAIRAPLSDEEVQQICQKADIMEACTRDITSAINFAIMEV